MSGWVKIHQIPHVFFFKLCITLQCHETWLFCIFSSKSLYALDKMIQSRCKFSDFQLLTWKLIKFLMSFLKPQVSFPLNFASPFSVMTHNPPQFFLAEILYAFEKRTHQCTIFQTFECCNEISPNFSCHFWNYKVRVYSNFTSMFSVMKDNSSVFFFSSNLTYFGQK